MSNKMIWMWQLAATFAWALDFLMPAFKRDPRVFVEPAMDLEERELVIRVALGLINFVEGRRAIVSTTVGLLLLRLHPWTLICTVDAFAIPRVLQVEFCRTRLLSENFLKKRAFTIANRKTRVRQRRRL